MISVGSRYLLQTIVRVITEDNTVIIGRIAFYKLSRLCTFQRRIDPVLGFVDRDLIVS